MPNLLKSITDPVFPTPTQNSSIIIGDANGNIKWVKSNTIIHTPVENTLYVSANGNDVNSGRAVSLAKRSIQAALRIATPNTTIVISAGVYREQSPLVVPADVSVVGDNVIVFPFVETTSVFLLNSGSVVDGITVKGIKAGHAAFRIAPNSIVYDIPVVKHCTVKLGPYLNDGTLFVRNQTIQNPTIGPTTLPIISVDISEDKQIDENGAGVGLLVDGDDFHVDSVYKTIKASNCTFECHGGTGVLARNSGVAVLLSSQTLYCSTAVMAVTGGEIVLNSVVTNYGLDGLVSTGFNATPAIVADVLDFEVDAETGFVSRILLANFSGYIKIGSIVKINSSYYVIYSLSYDTPQTTWINIVSDLIEVSLFSSLNIYRTSTVTAKSHVFHQVGSGVTQHAIQEHSDETRNVLEENYGLVHFDGVNTSGLYKIGNIFEINQLTGMVSSTPATDTLLNVSSLGPLIRNGIAVGVALKEISSNANLISSTGLPDVNTVPTQTAILSYLDQHHLKLSGGAVSGITSINTLEFENNQIRATETNQDIVISPSGSGNVDVNQKNIVNVLYPVNNTDAANKQYVLDLVQGGVTEPSVIPIIWGSTQSAGTLTLRSTQHPTKHTAGIIMDDEIESTSIDTGTLIVKGGVGISGNLNARTKSFNIEHPLDSSKRLHYGSLESPYHGVRLTGRDTVVNGLCVVQLPEYISSLIVENDINVQLTNYQHSSPLWIDDIDIKHNQFTVASQGTGNYTFFWTLTGIRADVEQLIVERIA